MDGEVVGDVIPVVPERRRVERQADFDRGAGALPR
jgi:hypothetical protein